MVNGATLREVFGMRNWKLPVYATLAYIFAGAGWIIAGYFLSGALYENEPAARFELLKGLAYVGITATVLFIALTYLDRRNVNGIIDNDLGTEFAQSLRTGDLALRWLPSFVIVVYTATILILALGLWWVREHTLQVGERSALALHKVHSAQISGALDIINFTLRDIANDVAENNLASPTDLQQHIQDIASLVSSLSITDAAGKTIYQTNSRAATLDRSSRDYFLHHKNAPDSGFYLSAPLRGEASGRWLIMASRPIRSGSGQFMGIVVAVIDPVIFGAYWREITSIGTTISIHQSDGILLLRSPYREEAIGQSDRHDLSIMAHSTGPEQQVFREKSLIDSENRIYAFGTVPGYPHLRMLIGLSEAELLQSWRAFALISLAIYLLVASGLAALTFALLRQLRERLVMQRKAAELARYPLQTPNPVLTVTSTGKRLFMNKAALQLVNSVHDSTAAQFDREIQAIANESIPGNREFAIGTRIMSASFVPHAPDYWDIYLTDVTTIRQGEHLLQLFFDLPFIGMAITSPETKHWLRFNNRLCKILGHTREQLEQKTWTELTHPDDLAADVAEFDRVMHDKSDGYAMDKRFIRPDGTVVDAVIDVHAVRRPDRSIELFVATVQDITERKQAERRLLEQRNLYAALTATNEAMIRLRDRDALFQRICEVSVERAGLAFAWVGLIDTAEKRIRPAARHGDDKNYIDSIEVSIDALRAEGRGPAGRLMTTGEHQVVNDVAMDPTLAPWLKATARSGVSALAVFPIRQGDSLIATLHLYSHDTGYFNTDIVRLLDEMVANLSFALDKLNNEAQRAQAVTELQRVESRLQFALQGGEHGVWEWNAQNNEVYFSPGWKAMLGYTDAEIGSSYSEWESRVHPDDLASTLGELHRFSSGETTSYVSEYRLRCKDGSHKWILDRGKAIIRTADGKPLQAIGTHTDISEERRIREQLSESEAKFKGLVEQSMIGIYMVDNQNMLYANPRTEEIFGYAPGEMNGIAVHALVAPEDRDTVDGNILRRTSGDIDSLRYEFRALRKDGGVIDVGVHGSRTILAGKPVVLGVLQDITDKRLHEERVREYVDRLERSIMSTVQAISYMVDLRDPYTAGHERRVGELAAAIGTEIGLSEDQVTGLRVAGGVHDVGKIAVPAEILSKPTRLSVAEFAIVKTHAQQGYEILKDIDFPWPVAQTVWQHHERLDGSGYPRGLRGDDISLEARIMAVADVVESMSTHRPYRPALGLEAAFTELQDKAGKLYDPAVVAACVRLFHEKGYTLPA